MIIILVHAPSAKRVCVSRPLAFPWVGAAFLLRMSHEGVPRSEDPARDLNNEIAELEARVAHPMHWTNGEHQLNLARLQQLIYEKQRRGKASASGNSPA